MPAPSPASVSLVDVDGERIESTAPVVPAIDGALLHGRAAFETIAAYGGEPFCLPAHLERLRRGCEALDLSPPAESIVDGRCRELLRANGLERHDRVRLRVTVTAGVGGSDGHVIVEATPAPDYGEPARVVTVPFVRNDRGALAGLKTINYGENAVALRRARESGADEALFANTRDRLCEGAWSNVFLRIDERWLTPPLSSGCLPGITRALVLEIAREIELSIEELSLPFEDTRRADAAFLTSTLREVQPIATLDGRPLVIAPETERLRAAYRERVTATA